MDLQIFEKLGFTKAEIDVYIMLLNHGSSTASKISEETRLNRSHIYDTLNKLIKKGFVSIYEFNKIKYFSSSPPEKIQEYIKEIEQSVNKILPELNIIKLPSKPLAKVQLFQGKEGIKTILKDIISEKKDYVVFGEEGLFEDIFPIYIEQFLRDVVHFKIKERVLTTKSSKNKILKTKNTQIKYLEDEFFSPTMTVVYGHKTAIFIWSEPYSVTLIQDSKVADSYRNYFNLLWKIAKK